MNSIFPKLFGLDGKDIWIFGGAGHLGRSVVSLAAEAGAKVLCVDLDDRADVFVKTSGLSESVTPAGLNVYDIPALRKFVGDQLEARGAPYGLVNMTFSSTAKTLEELTDADFDMVNHGGLTSAFVLARDVGRRMAEAGRGSMVLFSSMYGSVSPDPSVYQGPMNKNPIEYGVGKAGIQQMTRYLAVHWGGKGVRCNCISPGPFPNANVQRDNPEFIARLSGKTPLGRIGQPSELSGAVIFLLSEAASYITGQNLAVDGGWTVW